MSEIVQYFSMSTVEIIQTVTMFGNGHDSNGSQQPKQLQAAPALKAAANPGRAPANFGCNSSHISFKDLCGCTPGKPKL